MMLIYCAEHEHVTMAPGALDSIMKFSGGDMRRAVTLLQSSSQLRKNPSTPVTTAMVVDIGVEVPDNVIEVLWSGIRGNSFDGMRATVEGIIMEGHPLAGVLMMLHDRTVSCAELTDVDKAMICEKISQVGLSFHKLCRLGHRIRVN